jgi:succinate dehydrogenase/fumarate reductase flavoprotein subunit
MGLIRGNWPYLFDPQKDDSEKLSKLVVQANMAAKAAAQAVIHAARLRREAEEAERGYWQRFMSPEGPIKRIRTPEEMKAIEESRVEFIRRLSVATGRSVESLTPHEKGSSHEP